jgi:hypothetical protein
LAGVVGIKDPLSLENQLQAAFDDISFVILEEKPAEYRAMYDLIDSSTFADLLLMQMSAETYFAKHWTQHDVVWLDYWGGRDQRTIQSWQHMFDNGMLASPGFLAVTVCETRRLGEHDTKGTILAMGEEADYKIKPLGDMAYNQGTKSPMRVFGFSVC